MSEKFRLITRSDMDGLVCAILLKEMDIVDDILFVHPKDMQDGLIEISENDIITNLPYVPEAHLVFDHHASEMERVKGPKSNHIIDPHAPSAARVVYEFYGGRAAFPNVTEDMMIAVDKIDAAELSKDDILDPPGWILLGYLMDARTGLGRFREFRISNYQLMMDLIGYCRTNQDISAILELPDVAERVALYREHEEEFAKQLRRCVNIQGTTAILDLRNEETIYVGNRFMIYAMFPDTNISIHVMWGREKQNTVFALGKSIVNRTSKVNIGKLMLDYGGGGHVAAGTCQVMNDRAEGIRQELVEKIAATEAQ